MGEKRGRWMDRSMGIAEAGGTIPWLIVKMVQGDEEAEGENNRELTISDVE